MSPTGILFSYLIGLIFAVGGVLFLLALEDNRYLFGIPYLLIGLVIIGGVMGVQRRARRRDPEKAAADGDDAPPAEPPAGGER